MVELASATVVGAYLTRRQWTGCVGAAVCAVGRLAGTVRPLVRLDAVLPRRRN